MGIIGAIIIFFILALNAWSHGDDSGKMFVIIPIIIVIIIWLKSLSY